MAEIKNDRMQGSVLYGMAALVIIIAGMKYAAGLINSLLLSSFIAVNLSQSIYWLKQRKVPHGLAIALVFSLIISVFLLFGGVVSSSFSSFSKDLPKYEQNLKVLADSIAKLLQANGIDIATVDTLNVIDYSKVMSTVSAFLSDFGDIMGNSFTIFLLTLFLLLELESIPVKLKAISDGRQSSFAYLESIGNSIRGYLTIKTVTSVMTAAIVWVFLLLLKVDHAIIWALIAFLLNYIPNIGSIIAAVPAVLFALLQQGTGGAVWTAVVFLFANNLVGNVIEPRMMGKGLGLSTFVVFLSLLFWGFVLGTVGMFLSVPLTISCKIALEQNPNTKWIAVLLGNTAEAKNK